MSGCGGNELMPIDQALEQLLKQLPEPTLTEQVPLINAVGRVLAADIISPIDVPPADNSSMDGYALSLRELEKHQFILPVTHRIAAGDLAGRLRSGCARIFTGAEVPEGADAVVMQEQVTVLDNGYIQFPESLCIGQNIRRKGQDIKAGESVLSKGRRLTAVDLGVISSLGQSTVEVYPSIKVAVLSTGSELVEPGQPLQQGQIYNSNRYQLAGLLARLGVELVDLGRVEDTYEATVNALKRAANEADLVLSTGGVSVGEEDHVKVAIESLGELLVWRLKIKPGKPLAFGSISGTPFIGLPGNPSSALVTFCIIARPLILRMLGVREVLPKSCQLPAGFASMKAGSRQEYLRVRLENHRLVRFQNQSSGVLSSASWADGLAIIPSDTQVCEGDLVEYLSFSELFN